MNTTPVSAADPHFLALYRAADAAWLARYTAGAKAFDLARPLPPEDAALIAYACERGLCPCCGAAAHELALFCAPPDAITGARRGPGDTAPEPA